MTGGVWHPAEELRVALERNRETSNAQMALGMGRSPGR
jgi:hypothetical protein